MSPPGGGRDYHRRGPPGPVDVVAEDGSETASWPRVVRFPVSKLVTWPAWAAHGVLTAPPCNSQDPVTSYCPVCTQPPWPTEERFPLGVCCGPCSPSGCCCRSQKTWGWRLASQSEPLTGQAWVIRQDSAHQAEPGSTCKGVHGASSQPKDRLPDFLQGKMDALTHGPFLWAWWPHWESRVGF